MKILLIDKVHQLFKQQFQLWGWEVVEGFHWDYDKLLHEIASFNGIIIRSRFVMDKTILSNAKKLKFIGRPGAGLENIDLQYCKENEITVFRSPEGNRDAVGEHIMGMLLSLLNNLKKADQEVRNGRWLREENRGYELKGKTIGIIGYGPMGSCFAEKLSGFGVEVIAYDKYLDGFSSDIVKEVTLEDIFEFSDVVSLHTPLSKETNNMVDANFINSFKKPILFINSARGQSVVLEDLLQAINTKKVIGACLDVLAVESYSFESIETQIDSCLSELLLKENIVFSPHIAGWTFESKLKMAEVVIDKIKQNFNSES